DASLWEQALSDILYYVDPSTGAIRNESDLEAAEYQVVVLLTEVDPDHPLRARRMKANFLDEMEELANNDDTNNLYLQYFDKRPPPWKVVPRASKEVSTWTQQDYSVLSWLQPIDRDLSVPLPGPFPSPAASIASSSASAPLASPSAAAPL